jgi:probable selenium-dependent hydroxylase accessory protein YqeC
LALFDLLDLPNHSTVALIGGGGKTTIMFGIAAEARDRGRAVLVTTTTKIWPPTGLRVRYRRPTAGATGSGSNVLQGEILVLGEELGQDGKVRGLDPASICSLHQEGAAELILCEADGAAGRSIKVHGEHEPVIPPCAMLILVIAGLDVIGLPISAQHVHRLSAFLALADAQEGEPILPRHVARALDEAVKRVPAAARVIFVLNKADTSRSVRLGRAVVGALLEGRPGIECVLASNRIGGSDRVTGVVEYFVSSTKA